VRLDRVKNCWLIPTLSNISINIERICGGPSLLLPTLSQPQEWQRVAPIDNMSKYDHGWSHELKR
jgi:hypothetical protein